MAGSKRGPAPKRAEDRERRNTPATGDAIAITPDDMKRLPFDVELLVEPPAPDDEWEPAAKRVYEATLRDPARIWMGPLDWAAHWLICESLSRDLAPQYVATMEGDNLEPEDRVVRERIPMKGASLTAYLKWFGMIGVGESSRLALRREVTFNEAPRAELASVSELDVAPTREGFFQDGAR
jgi:hypothetical protein